MEIYDRVYNKGHVPLGWEKLFASAKQSVKQACENVSKMKGDIVPRTELIFAAFDAITPENVRVVIVGQDPYPNIDNAAGLSFSCNVGIPPSLNNIYSELVRDIPGFVRPKHGDISSWCNEGVMLLNMSLTTKSGVSNAHEGCWLSFINAVVNTLTSINKKIIWVMWGAKAQKLSKFIGDRGLKITAAHPSSMNTGGGFAGCKHFSKINAYLVKNGQEPIDWTVPVNRPKKTIVDETSDSD